MTLIAGRNLNINNDLWPFSRPLISAYLMPHKLVENVPREQAELEPAIRELT